MRRIHRGFSGSSFGCWPVLAVAVVVLGLLPAAPVQASGKKSAKPNVLFIAVDDLNDWVQYLQGHPQAKTPNLKRLVKMGVAFTHAYCSAPSCNPSRASIMTGKRPSTSGVYFNNQDWRPPLQDVMTLQRLFMMHGYLVWGGGKIYHGSYPEPKGDWHEYFHGKMKIPNAQLPKFGIGGNMTWGPLQAGDDVMPDTQMIDWAIGKLKQKHKQPFFLAAGFHKPHLSWHVPEKYFKEHPLATIQLPVVRKDDLDDIPPAGIKMAKPNGDHKAIVKAGLWKEAVQAYLANISYMDAQLGRLLDALAASDYAEDTIIVLWSDHGWHLGQKEHWRKFALWEEATHVPFIIVAPGVTQPQQFCERTVNLMDMYPTLTELCSLPLPKGVEANSLVPLLKNPKLKWDHPSLMTWGRNNHAVRTEQWRYIRYADGSEELYDHDFDHDRYEWFNLAKHDKFVGVKQELSAYFPKVNAAEAPMMKEKKDKSEE